MNKQFISTVLSLKTTPVNSAVHSAKFTAPE